MTEICPPDRKNGEKCRLNALPPMAVKKEADLGIKKEADLGIMIATGRQIWYNVNIKYNRQRTHSGIQIFPC